MSCIIQQRHKTDRKVNNRQSMVLRDGFLVEEKWHRVQVSKIAFLQHDNYKPSDIGIYLSVYITLILKV